MTNARFPSSADVTRAARVSVVTRRRLLAGSALLATPWIRTARADGAPIVLRLGHAAPATFPLHYRLVEAAGQISLKSKGQVKLQVFPDGQLGSPVGLMAQVRAGSLDAAALPNETLAADLNTMALPYVGFAWTGYDTLWRALDGDLGALLVRQMKDRLGLTAMPRCMDFGFRQITTWDKPIQTAADIVGLRIRTPADAPFIQLLEALRARPVSYSLQDMDKALRSHAAEGQQGLLSLVKVAKIYEVQNRCALTNHMWDGLWVLFAHKAWDGLPDDLRPIVTAAIDEAVTAQRKDNVENDASLRTFLEKQGMRINTVDPASFRDALRKAGYYKTWRGRVPEEAWTMLEKFTGPLASG